MDKKFNYFKEPEIQKLKNTRKELKISRNIQQQTQSYKDRILPGKGKYEVKGRNWNIVMLIYKQC